MKTRRSATCIITADCQYSYRHPQARRRFFRPALRTTRPIWASRRSVGRLSETSDDIEATDSDSNASYSESAAPDEEIPAVALLETPDATQLADAEEQGARIVPATRTRFGVTLYERFDALQLLDPPPRASDHPRVSREQDGDESDGSMPGLLSESELSTYSTEEGSDSEFSASDEEAQAIAGAGEGTTPESLVLRFGYVCPLCLEADEDVSSTECGHVFCTR